MFLIVSSIKAHAGNPDITSVSPTTICSGETLTINGSGFTDSPAMDKVVLNGVEITSFESKSNTVATVIVPSGAVTDGSESIDIEAYNGTTLHDTYTTSMNIGPVPADPTGATDNEYCEGDAITSISVNDPGNDYSVMWYNSSVGSTLASGTTSGNNGEIFTPSTDATDTYHAEIEHDASGCVSDNRVGVTITRNDTPSDPSGASDESYCEGDPIPAISVNDPGGGYTVMWYASSGGGTLASGTTGGNNGEEFTADNPGTATYYAEVVDDGTACVSLNRLGVTLTENTIPSTPTISTAASAPYCSGTTITLEADVVATDYIWYRDGSPIGGATNQTYDASLAGDYTVKAVNGGCESPESAAFTISSTPSTPTITTAASAPYCAGVTITLDAGAGGDTYIWYQDAVEISGQTGQTYDTDEAGDYTVIAVSAENCESSESAPFTIGTVPDPPLAGQASYDICGDGNIDISATLAGTSTPGTDYRIQFSDDGGTNVDHTENSSPFDWDNIPVTVGSPKTINIRTQNKDTDCASDWSATSTVLTANPEPTIDTQPTDQTVCESEQTTFEVTASGVTLAYQWQYNDGSWNDVPSVGGDPYSGETTSILTVTGQSALDGYDYRVVVSETSGNIVCPVNSSARTLTVNTPAEIVFDNVPTSVCIPDNATFSINLEATIQNGTVNDGIWEVISGTGGFGNSSPGTDPLTISDPTDPDTKYWPTYIDVANESVTLRLSADNQGVCSSQIDSEQRTIAFIQKSSPTIITSSTEVCPEAIIDLEGVLSEGGTGGTWSTVPTDNPSGFGDVNSLVTTYTPSASDLSNGSVTIQLEQTGGACGDPDPAQVTIDFYSSPVTGNIITDSEINTLDSVCQGSKGIIYMIEGDPPSTNTYLWDIPAEAGTQATGGNSSSITVNVSSDMEDTIIHTISSQVMDINGCQGNVSTLDVKVVPLPNVIIGNTTTDYSFEAPPVDLIGLKRTIINGTLEEDTVKGNDILNLLFTGPGVTFNYYETKYEFDPGAAGKTFGGYHNLVMNYTDPGTGCKSINDTLQVTVFDPNNTIINLDPEYCVYDDVTDYLELRGAPEPIVPPDEIRKIVYNYGDYYDYTHIQNPSFPYKWDGNVLYVEDVVWLGFQGPGLIDETGGVRFDPSSGSGNKTIQWIYQRVYSYRLQECTNRTFFYEDPLDPGKVTRTECNSYETDPDSWGLLPGYESFQYTNNYTLTQETLTVHSTPAEPHIVDNTDGINDDSLHYCLTDDINDVIIANADTTSTYNWYSSESGSTLIHTVDKTDDFTSSPGDLGITNTPQTFTYYVSQLKHESTTFNGCEGPRQEINVNIYDIPTQPVLADYAGNYCDVDDVEILTVLNPMEDDLYTWYDQNGAGDKDNIILSDANSFKPDFTSVPKPVDTTFFITKSKNEIGLFEGCESNSLTINIKVNLPPNVSFSGLANKYCIDYEELVDLLGLPVGEGGVFIGNGINDLGQGLAEFSVADAAESADTSGVVTSHEIKFIYTDENGCTDSSSQVVMINPLPEPDFNIQDGKEFCHEDPLFDLFDDTESVTSLTSKEYTTQKLGPIGEAYEPRFVGTDVITYSVEDQNGCTNSISKTVIVNPLPSPEFELTSQCNNEEIVFLNQSTIESGSIANWKWEFGDGDTSVAESPVHIYDQSKQYNVNLIAISDKGCEESTTQLVSIGRLPGIDFDFIGECEGGMTEFDASVNDPEADIISWQWDFNDNGSISTQPMSTNHLFSEQGDFTVTLTVETREGCVEEEEKRVLILPTLDLTQNYFEDFEQNTESWIPEDIRPGIIPENQKWSWEINDPSMEYIAPEPENGANFWATTNFEGGYDLSETSALNSPCFNLSNFKKPMISFDRYKDLEETRDGVTFQYSLDNGSTWYILGEEAQGVNWYDTRGIIGLTEVDEENRSNGWTGEQNEWLTSRFNLDLLAYDSIGVVRFRLVLGSDNAKNNTGFGFDNVFIGERNRTVLIEQFANRNKDESIDEENEIDALVAGNEELITIKYHTGYPAADVFSVANKTDPGGRSIFYGVSSVPYSIIDGNIRNTLPFSSGWGSLETSKRILDRADFDLSVSTPPSGEDFLNIEASILSLNEYSGTIKAFIAVIEDSATADNGEWTTHIVRKLLPDVSGYRMDRNWGVNDEEIMRFTYDLKNFSDISNDNITIVFFIQDENTREILQATAYKTNNALDRVLGLENSLEPHDFARVFPNPADDHFKVEFLNELNNSYQWFIIDQRGVNLAEGVISPGGSMAEFDATKLPSGLNHLIIKNDQDDFYIFKLLILH